MASWIRQHSWTCKICRTSNLWLWNLWIQVWIKGIKFLNTSETNSNFTSQIKTSLVPELISLRNGAYPFAKIVKLVNIQIVKLGFGNTRLCKWRFFKVFASGSKDDDPKILGSILIFSSMFHLAMEKIVGVAVAMAVVDRCYNFRYFF